MNEQERLDLKKESNNLLEEVITASDDPKSTKKKNYKKIIIVVVIAAVALAGIGYLSTIPKKQAQSEVAEYIETYDEKLSSGDYIALSTESLDLQEKDEKYLSDEEKNELIIRSNYAIGLNELDFRQKIPTYQPDYYKAIEALNNTSDYGVSSTLGAFIEAYDNKTGSIEGTVAISPKKDKDADKEDDTVSEINDSIITTTAFVGGTLPTRESSGASESASPDTYQKKYGSGSETTNEENKEEEPIEYPCTGDVYIGFDKISQSGSVSEGNIKTAYALKITLSDQVEEIKCKEYEAIVYTEDKENFTITGIDDKNATAKGSFDGSTWTFDFGDGITATLKKPERQYSSNSSSSSKSSNSSNSSKDYSEGSEWENYDSDKDGKISDDEFQNATGDYIDKYFEENGTNGDLNAYDYNGNSEMENNEFQDAVKDYMDENGY